MKTVSRLTYTFWSLFYHLLCLCGLIWQATQISINFFEFDVNKDINIRMPSEFNFRAGKSVYLCFEMEEFYDQEQFRDLMLVWSKSNETAKQDVIDWWKREGISRDVADSFIYRATVGEIFRAVLNESIIYEKSIIEILFAKKICFTSSETELGPILFGDRYWHWHTKRVNRVLDNVTSISVALGDNYPYFDPQSLIEIDNIRTIGTLYLRSYSYNIIKKEFPYSDKCYDYRLSKIVNQYEAMIKCHEESWGNKFALYYRIISKNDSHFYNLTRKGRRNRDCNQRPDCNRTVHFTSFKARMRHENVSNFQVLIWPREGKEPSFTLVSKPRIDNIDYVTYILGALGSWLGFSFLGINPVPCLLTVATPSNHVEDLSNQSNNSNYIIILSNRVARNETKCNESKQQLKIDFESKIEQQNQGMKIHDRVIRKLIAEINSLKQNQDV